MNHSQDGIPHKTNHKCKYQHQYDNQRFFCRACYERGEEVVVTQRNYASDESTWLVGMAKCAWSGTVTECRLCGIIHRSRQYWYGNKDPTQSSLVRNEILHVWEGVS